MPTLLIGLVTFLRGMETGNLSTREQRRFALKPSLEGWKLPEGRYLLVAMWALETFLRGMETGIGVPRHVRIKALETFLRGMETEVWIH